MELDEGSTQSPQKGGENRPRRLSDTISTGVGSLDFCNHPTVQQWQLKPVWLQPEGLQVQQCLTHTERFNLQVGKLSPRKLGLSKLTEVAGDWPVFEWV